MAQALEYDLVEKSSEDFYCPITMEILTEPHQTMCCGNHLSPEAADRLKREGKPCPMCKEPNLTTVFDKYFKRMVYQLKVRCPKKALGCDWVGELADLEKHLSEGSVDGECPFVAVAYDSYITSARAMYNYDWKCSSGMCMKSFLIYDMYCVCSRYMCGRKKREKMMSLHSLNSCKNLLH